MKSAAKGISILRSGLFALTHDREPDRPTFDDSLLLPEQPKVNEQKKVETNNQNIKSRAEKRKSRLGTTAHLSKKVEFTSSEREIVFKKGYINYIKMKNGRVYLLLD